VLKYKVEKPIFEADEFANLVEEVLGLTDNH